MKRALWLALLFALGLSAADLDGKWAGTIDVKDAGSGTTITTPVQVQIEHKANALSGHIGRPEDNESVPIRNARVEGKTLYFEASNGETEGAVRFVLTLEGDRLEGEMKGSVDTGDIVGKVKLTRAK
jgi:hypothetical protein